MTKPKHPRAVKDDYSWVWWSHCRCDGCKALYDATKPKRRERNK